MRQYTIVCSALWVIVDSINYCELLETIGVLGCHDAVKPSMRVVKRDKMRNKAPNLLAVTFPRAAKISRGTPE